MRLVQIPTAMLPRAWPVLGGFIARACDRSGCWETELSLAQSCLSREATLIAIHDQVGRPVAAGITQVRETPDGLACWVLAMGGSRCRAWIGTLFEIEAGARRLGCATVEFVGRTGWRRLLPGYAAFRCEAGIHYVKTLGI